MNEEESEKRKIIFWLHRVLSEKCEDIKKLGERVSILNHQIKSFSKMQESSQEDVVEDLITDMRGYGWNDSINELGEEFIKDTNPSKSETEVKE